MPYQARRLVGKLRRVVTDDEVLGSYRDARSSDAFSNQIVQATSVRQNSIVKSVGYRRPPDGEWFGVGKLLKSRHILEWGDAYDLLHRVQRHIEIQSLSNDGHPDPYLRFHCILRSAEEMFDVQVLLNPLEEYFDLPVQAIQSQSVKAGSVT